MRVSIDKNLGGKLYDINITLGSIVMSMDEEAYDSFWEMRYKKDVSFSQFVKDFFGDDPNG